MRRRPLHEDWAIIQAIDPETGRDVPDGQWGNLVVTTLDRDNGLLRYDLEEAAMLEDPACPLGETGRIGFWGGRFKDLLSCQGVHFQVSDLEKTIKRSAPGLSEPTLEYVVVNPAGSHDALVVRVELGASGGDVARRGRSGHDRDQGLLSASMPPSRCSTAARCPDRRTSSSGSSTHDAPSCANLSRDRATSS